MIAASEVRRLEEPVRESERVIVLCVGEKSQIPTLDRSQPMVPCDLARRRTAVMTGVTSLFAASTSK
ncbi:hypothetical protein Q2941_43980 [Bradyrhizobium sp. UFLA05-153]